MNFSTKYTVRTDLADEVIEGLRKKEGKTGDGITFKRDNIHGICIDTINVENESAGRDIGKPQGKYITVTTGEIWRYDKDSFENAALVISDILRKMLPDGLCLVACLGNDKITADAIGPLTADSLIVSRHIKLNDKELFSSLGLGECACIVPGVMGDTGAEAFELIQGAVEKLHPSSVIVIDALASRDVSRLAKTVQISDSGIHPGAGVGNARHEISCKTLGVPTIAVGVPTVVEALTLSLDLLSEALENEKEVYGFVEQKLSQNMGRFFVCPKECDKIIRSMAKLIGYSLNFALHKDMTISDIDEFLS